MPFEVSELTLNFTITGSVFISFLRNLQEHYFDMLHDHTIIFLLVIYAAAAADPYHILLNCGGDAHGDKHWLREGSSTVSTTKGGLITDRISGSRFSYSLKLSPGQKILRLHFHPSSYNGFESSNDLFSVEAGNSSLLANFSASVAARALAVNVIVKQFCVTVEENETLNLAFSPALGNSYYAFVNEIEIISIPYCDGGVEINPIIHVDNSTALERVHYQHTKWGPVSSGDDIASMFGMWSKQPRVGEDAEIGTNKTWRVSVDTGFKYLVRLHLCEAGLHMEFVLLINGRVALTSADMLQQRRGNRELFWYNNYMVVDEELKQGDISISLHSRHEFLDRHGPLEGFEVFKMSSQQSAIFLIRIQDPPLLTLLHSQVYSILFHICCIVFLVYLKHKLSQYKFTREDNKPLAREKQPSHRFSLARILEKCGYGGDEKGFVDYGREIVVIKPLKMDSNQTENKFWNVIEALWGLRHVSLIGHCREQEGVADHFYKIAMKSNNFFSQSWNQRLQICVEVFQALEYLHTGPMVIHHDLKPANILIDDKFVARLADFGVTKTVSFSESQSQGSTKLIGTLGYAALDLISSGEGTKHSDIYSFGALVLEVLRGRAGREPQTKVEDVDYDKIDFCNHEEVELGVLVDSLTGSQQQQMPPGFEVYPTDAELAVIFAEMKSATRNFESDTVLGMGGSGRGFKRFIYSESDLRFREWQLFLGRLSHPNLLKLLGCRLDDNEMLLVYKYMSKGSLENHLFHCRRVTCYAGTNIQSKKVRNSCWYSVHGEGGFGTVYKGWIHEKSSAKEGSGIPVAVKKSNHQCAQGFREGQSQVQFLGRHPNLVKLWGYCWEDNKLLLVHEYMIKGSFENHPFESYGQPLPWDIRIHILIGASRGLQNLHSSDIKVIYRDFKSSKILLDKSYNAKLSDFGLATTGPFSDKTPVSARIMGTFGYTAPEYIMTGHVNVKSDVYGFGVLLLEVLTGLQAIDQRRSGEQQNLVVCMKPHLSDPREMINSNSWLLMIFGTTPAMHAVEVPVICRDFKASNILLDDVKLGVLMDSSTGSHQWQIDRCSTDTAVNEQPPITAAPTPARKQVQVVQQTEHNKAHVPAQAPAHSDWSKQKRDAENGVEWSGVEIINNILLLSIR